MKIDAVDVRLVDAGFRNLIVTQVHTDDGRTGISEVVTKRFDDATAKAIRNLVENIGLIGRDPRRTAMHFERMYRDNQWTTGSIAVTAISALDIAFWDLKAQEVDKPVYELFGGPTFTGRIPVYCHVPGGASREARRQHRRRPRARLPGYEDDAAGLLTPTVSWAPWRAWWTSSGSPRRQRISVACCGQGGQRRLRRSAHRGRRAHGGASVSALLPGDALGVVEERQG